MQRLMAVGTMEDQKRYQKSSEIFSYSNAAVPPKTLRITQQTVQLTGLGGTRCSVIYQQVHLFHHAVFMSTFRGVFNQMEAKNSDLTLEIHWIIMVWSIEISRAQGCSGITLISGINLVNCLKSAMKILVYNDK